MNRKYIRSKSPVRYRNNGNVTRLIITKTGKEVPLEYYREEEEEDEEEEDNNKRINFNPNKNREEKLSDYSYIGVTIQFFVLIIFILFW